MQKALLLAAMGDLLPSEITAQKKRTFTLPWEQWLRGPLKPRVEESFASVAAPLSGLINKEGLREVWKSFLDGRTSWSRPWSLFVLNEWARRN
jgi:asparagine synthase (glutamine-hydrolysing)